MNTFKKGDRFRCHLGTFTVGYTSGPYVYYTDGIHHRSIHATNCTLVEAPFMPGDYVRHPRITDTGVGVILDKRPGEHGNYSVKWPNSRYGECRDHESNLILVSRANAVDELVKAGRKIEAIKEYRTIHGVGLKEAKDAIEAMADKPQTLGDILSAALNKPKYKVGDKVHTEGDEADVGTVLGFRDEKYAVQFNCQAPGVGEGAYIWCENKLFPAKPIVPTIVVRKDAGIGFRPNDTPRVHDSVEAAIAEAERLAKLNPGVEFCTFTLVSTSTGTKPVAPTVTTVKAAA